MKNKYYIEKIINDIILEHFKINNSVWTKKCASIEVIEQIIMDTTKIYIILITLMCFLVNFVIK